MICSFHSILMIQNVLNIFHFSFAWMALLLMHEETSICPYIGYCRDVQTLKRGEAQLIRDRRNFFSQPTMVDQGDYRVTIDEYRRRVESIGKAMGRCRKFYRRCLRFWQLQEMEESEAYVRLLMDGATAAMRRS